MTRENDQRYRHAGAAMRPRDRSLNHCGAHTKRHKLNWGSTPRHNRGNESAKRRIVSNGTTLDLAAIWERGAMGHRDC